MLSFDFTDKPVSRYTPGKSGFVTETELERYPALRIPELNSGFMPAGHYRNVLLTEIIRGKYGVAARPTAAVREEDLQGRALPLWYKVDTGPGRFRVTVTLCGEGTEALLFTGRRRLCWRGTLEVGQLVTVTTLCEASPVIAVGGGDAALGDLGRMEDISLDVAVVDAELVSLKVESWEGPALYLMGDSTVTDQPADTPYAPGATYAGWGQMLPLFLGEQYCVVNHAHSGLSTESFRERGHYKLLCTLLRPGDMVMIQFGHNDQKRKHLAADTGYTENLTQYIQEFRASDVRPVLVTPLSRNTWRSETEYNDMLAPFAAAMQTIGGEQNVPVLDLHAAMKDAVCRTGLEGSRVWFHPGDFTHTNDFGAHMAAGFVASELVRAGLAKSVNVPVWPVREPLTVLASSDVTPLVDYGLIPDAPWDVTS